MNKKEIGFIGLGRMGFNMACHLKYAEYRVVGYDSTDSARTVSKEAGIEVTESLEQMVSTLSKPSSIWLMVPSQYVDDILQQLIPILQPGDTVIDGGNSFYQDSIRRESELKKSEINYLDCGTSGGMKGARDGASLMVGGKESVFIDNEHIFKTLAAPNAYARVGKTGAGHFVKMVHNGIEYGMMGAIAEGMTVLKERSGEHDLDLKAVLYPYEHESVISSKLVSWLAEAYREGQIEAVKGEVPVGETENEMEHLTTLGETWVLEAALAQRRQSRDKETYLGKLVAAMRNQFGGHKVIKNQDENSSE